MEQSGTLIASSISGFRLGTRSMALVEEMTSVGMPNFFTAPEKHFPETFGITGQADEQSPRLLDTFFADSPED